MELDREIPLRDRLRASLVELAKGLAFLVRKGEAHIGRVELSDRGQESLLRLNQGADGRGLQGGDAVHGRGHDGVAYIELGALDLGLRKLDGGARLVTRRQGLFALLLGRDLTAGEFLDPVEVLLGLTQGRLRLGKLSMGAVEGKLVGRRIDPEQDLPLSDPGSLLELPPQEQPPDPRPHLHIPEANDAPGIFHRQRNLAWSHLDDSDLGWRLRGHNSGWRRRRRRAAEAGDALGDPGARRLEPRRPSEPEQTGSGGSAQDEQNKEDAFHRIAPRARSRQ